MTLMALSLKMNNIHGSAVTLQLLTGVVNNIGYLHTVASVRSQRYIIISLSVAHKAR